MSRPFADRHVVVTGGTGALGSAVVALLLEQGAYCHVPVWKRRELDHFAFAEHERVNAVDGVDLARESDAEHFYQALPGLWASLQIAGGFSMSPITETSLAAYERMLDMNAKTCFLSCREAIKRIRARGDGEGGRLVNVAARPALIPSRGMIAYVASKAAVAAMTLSLAEELAEERIWVNAVVPSILDTPANRRAMPDANHALWPNVEDGARTMVFLASPENRATRGGLVPVYGGA